MHVESPAGSPPLALPEESSARGVGAFVRTEVLPLALLYAGTVVLYLLLGRLQVVPLVTPDEFTYGQLAKSVADGNGFQWRGDPFALRSGMYVYAITPAWLLSSSNDTAYEIVKAINAGLLSLVVVPVWLLTRALLASRGLALIAALLSVAGTWMITSSLLATENIALPIATACLTCAVMAVRRQSSRWWLAALGLAVLGGWARTQLLLLVLVLFLAAVLDIARARSDWRERANAHRAILLPCVGLLVVAAVVWVAAPHALAGVHEGALHYSPSLGDLTTALGRHWIALAAMTGFVPLFALLAGAGSPGAWRDDAAGPLLTVLIPATLCFILQSSWYTAGYTDPINRTLPFAVQRYVEYVVPLAIVLMVVLAVRAHVVSRIAAAVAAVLVVLPMFGTEAIKNWPEERAVYGVVTRMDDLFGLGPGAGAGLLAIIVVGGAIAAVWLMSRRSRPAGMIAGALAVVTLVALVPATQAAWKWQIDIGDAWRDPFPASLTWIDDVAPGPVARVVLNENSARFQTVEFFNSKVQQVYVPDSPVEGKVIFGKTCKWSLGARGEARFAPACGTPARTLYLDDPSATVTFHGQRILRRTANAGRLVAVPANPRVEAIMGIPCEPPTLVVLKSGEKLDYSRRICHGGISGTFYLDRPATLRLRVRGGRFDHLAQVRNKVVKLPAGRTTTIVVKVPARPHRVGIPFDDVEDSGAPDLVSAELVRDGRARSIL